VEESWRGHNVGGWMSFVLKEKLKFLKHRIKEWNKDEYERMDERVEVLTEEIKGLDEKGEVGGLSDLEVLNRKDKFGELWRLLKGKNAMMVQRSRSK
jgi:ornithine cyclodeaminase/alanine dehydrogenase-like protein (mu-crystallin family)